MKNKVDLIPNMFKGILVLPVIVDMVWPKRIYTIAKRTGTDPDVIGEIERAKKRPAVNLQGYSRYIITKCIQTICEGYTPNECYIEFKSGETILIAASVLNTIGYIEQFTNSRSKTTPRTPRKPAQRSKVNTKKE